MLEQKHTPARSRSDTSDPEKEGVTKGRGGEGGGHKWSKVKKETRGLDWFKGIKVGKVPGALCCFQTVPV